MRTFPKTNFSHLKSLMGGALVNAPEVEVGEWQAQQVTDPSMITLELQDVIFEIDVPETSSRWAEEVKPNLPWAEDHFLERVSGEPLNPPPSSAAWPYTRGEHGEHTNERGMFSHTYPERFWPKFAENNEGNKGIRFNYGDLSDVVLQLHRSPYTRQAYLPVWFPEDTGAVSGHRVPCSLGYHFLIRNGHINVTYLIRSCDFVRHFPDDVYMAGRLMQWMVEQLEQWQPGTLTMWMGSFHIFAVDIPRLTKEWNEHLFNSF